MDVVVKGRNVEVPEHFRSHVTEKLARSERYDPKIIRVEVELSHETNRRQSKTCQRVQITLLSKGPAVRAEDCGDTFYVALDGAVVKLESRLRKSADRRHHRQHARTPISAVATSVGLLEEAPAEIDRIAADGVNGYAGSDDEPGRIVRIKNHPAEPTTVDQALLQMELVGHDFYLFNDEDSGLPSVVYRRHGYDYGLLRLGGTGGEL
jgi:ribosomal subunit interface protein